MAITVTCPACNTSLQCGPQHLGKQVACPSCKTRFALPPPLPDAGSAPQRLPSAVSAGRLPAIPTAAEAESPGRHFARRMGLNLDEWYDPVVGSAADADWVEKQWREELPAVPSAYQPSGALPASALLTLVLGTAAGVLVGTLAGLVVAAGVGVVVGLLGLLVGLMFFCGYVLIMGIILFVLGAVVGLGLTFAAAGWGAAMSTTQAGRWGKNRNQSAAVVLSQGSAGLAVTLLWLLYQVAGQPFLETRGWAPPQLFGLDLIPVGVALLGVVVAVIVAAKVAGKRVLAAKFCEDCDQFMDVRELNTLSRAVLRAAVLALAQGDLEAAASLLDEPQAKEGKAALFACPSCRGVTSNSRPISGPSGGTTTAMAPRSTRNRGWWPRWNWPRRMWIGSAPGLVARNATEPE